MEQLPAKPICQTCFHLLDGATAIDGSDDKVSKGDVSICIYCGQVSVYTEGLDLRKITEEELKEMQEENPTDYAKLLLTQVYIKAKISRN